MSRVVVFDLDDTLYLERDYVRSGFEAVGAHLRERSGTAGFAKTAWDHFESGLRGTIFDATLSDLGLDVHPALVRELVGVYRDHVPRIGYCRDADDLIRQVARSARLAIITDGTAVGQRRKAEALGTDRWSELTVFTDELGVGHWKPSPLAFEQVMDHTEEPAEHHVYIGDNPHKDFVAPHALGWSTVRIRRPGQLHQREPSGADVHVEVDDLRSVPELLSTRR